MKKQLTGILILPFIAVTPPDDTNAARKRRRQFCEHTDTTLMAKDLGIDAKYLDHAITHPGNSPLMNKLWQTSKPLSERCLDILRAIRPLDESAWTKDQIAGIAMLAKAIYLNPISILDMAKRKTDNAYLRKFIGLDDADRENFQALIEKERKKFRKGLAEFA